MKINLGRYAKAIVAAAAAIGVTGGIVADGLVSSEEWIALLSAWAGVFGVYQVRNQSK